MEILKRSLSLWSQVLDEYGNLESTNAQLEEHCHNLERQLAEKDRQLQQEIQQRQEVELQVQTWRDRCKDSKQLEDALQKLNEELEERVLLRTLELLQARDFLQTIVDNIPVAVFVKNGRQERFGQFLLWNSTCETLFGYTREQAIGKTVYDFFPEEQSNFFALKDRQSFERGEVEDIPEEPIDSLTLGKRLLHTIKVPICDENGDPKYLVCISEDITDRQQTEQRLRESQQLLQLVFDTLPQRVFWKDRNFRFLGCNKLLAQDVGLESPEQIVGKDDFDIRTREFAHLYRADDMHVLHNNISRINFEERQVREDGSIYWLRTTKVPLRNEAGEAIGIFGSYEDITDRKQAENRLQQESLRLQLALEAAEMGTWECDLDAGYWSERTEAIFGYAPGTFPGDSNAFLRSVHIEDRDRVVQSLAHSFATLSPYSVEYRINRLDGEMRWVAVRGKVVQSEDSSAPRMVGVALDITERKQAEEALRQANIELEFRVEELTAELKQAMVVAESANHAKSEFLANVSHEMRTPLNGILGYAQILQGSPTLSKLDKRGVDVIYRCGNHLLTLISDILDLSKIEARKLDLHPNEFYLRSLLQDLVDICRIRADQKGLLFVYQPQTILPTGIFYADEKRLRQVLLNLLSNAIKFTDRGCVTFKVEVIARENVPTTYDNRQTTKFTLRFEVEDTGIGIPLEQLDRIFLPFEQVGSHERKSEGTGLGLAIASNILEMMGTTLRVRSQHGRGSVFGFDLQLLEAITPVQVRDKSPRKIAGYTGKPRKILIVDDEMENRSIFVHLLQPLGFLTIEASSGQEGLDKAVEFRPDLIVADLSMPEMDGWEMIRHLRELPQGENLAIVASSARVSEQDIQQSLDAGAHAFLPKPIKTREFLALIQRHLQLEWIDEETRSAMQQQDVEVCEIDEIAIAVPPIEILDRLLDLSRRGNLQGLTEAASELEQTDVRFMPLAVKLRELADGFRIKEIQTFLHSLQPRDEQSRA